MEEWEKVKTRAPRLRSNAIASLPSKRSWLSRGVSGLKKVEENIGALVPLPRRPPRPSGIPETGCCCAGAEPPTLQTAPALINLFAVLLWMGDEEELGGRIELCAPGRFGVTLLAVKGSGLAPSVRVKRSSGDISFGSLFRWNDLITMSPAILEGM